MSKSAKGNSTEEITEHNKRVMRKARKGDLIEFPRDLYTHWAVYVGDDKVIELTTHPHPGSSKAVSGGTQEGEVREIDFMETAGSSMARINNDMDKEWEPRSPSEIVKTARESLGKRIYHFLKNNCEHFAKFCRYGKQESHQVKKFFEMLQSTPQISVMPLLASFVVSRTKSSGHSLHQ